MRGATSSRVWNSARLEQLFAGRGLDWVLERIRQRLERGAGLAGTISLQAPSTEQRAAYARLLGIPAPGARALTIKLADLERVLRDAEICEDLAAAAEHLGGPIVDRRARRAHVEAAWTDLFHTALHGATVDETLYLGDLRATGLLRRLCPAPVESAGQLLARSLRVARRLPLERPTPLANVAADVLGDSHALDHGRPVHALVLRYLAIRTGILGWETREARRQAFARVGVIVDELSAPALILGLRARGDGFTARTLQLHADAHEPCRLSTRQLLRERLDWIVPRRVFVCENPAVVASAAGSAGAPLVCIEGQPATAARLVVQQLASAGATLHYHGDFDWAGLTIANYVVREHGARPWRMGAADYLAADDTKGVELRGDAVEAAWDPELADAMKTRGFAVHEEQVIETLLADLATEMP